MLLFLRLLWWVCGGWVARVDPKGSGQWGGRKAGAAVLWVVRGWLSCPFVLF